MNSNNKMVKQVINQHILDHFTEDYGWPKGSEPLDNLKLQLRSFDYMPTEYSKGLYMVEGGSFLIYYTDQRAFLDSLGINKAGKVYSNEQVFKNYCHLIARQIAELVS